MKKLIYWTVLTAVLFLCLAVSALTPIDYPHKFKTVHDITVYGAKGDGVTDDAAAIQAAVDAATITGGTVFTPVTDSGFMIDTTIFVSSGVMLSGGGYGSMWFMSADSIPRTMVRNADTVNGDTGIVIENMRFDGRRSYTEFLDSDSADCVSLINVHRSEVRNCWVTGTDMDGIALRRGTDNKIYGNHVWETGQDAITVAGVGSARNIVTMNILEGRDTSYEQGGFFPSGILCKSSEVEITNNIIRQFGAALDINNESGDTLRDLTITGNTIIESRQVAISIADGYRINISANTFVNNADIGIFFWATSPTSHHNKVEGNVFSNNAGIAIKVTSGEDYQILDNLIVGNDTTAIFSGAANSIVSNNQIDTVDAGYGIHLTAQAATTLSINEVTAASLSGIYLEQFSTNVEFHSITGNILFENGEYGINAVSLDYSSITANICVGNLLGGIHLSNSDQNTLTSNVSRISADSASAYGLLLESNSNKNTIHGNAFGGNNTAAISGGSDNLTYGNRLDTTATNAFRVDHLGPGSAGWVVDTGVHVEMDVNPLYASPDSNLAAAYTFGGDAFNDTEDAGFWHIYGDTAGNYYGIYLTTNDTTASNGFAQMVLLGSNEERYGGTLMKINHKGYGTGLHISKGVGDTAVGALMLLEDFATDGAGLAILSIKKYDGSNGSVASFRNLTGGGDGVGGVIIRADSAGTEALDVQLGEFNMGNVNDGSVVLNWPGGSDGQGLLFQADGTAKWETIPGAGGGEVNTMSKAGTGHTLFKAKSGVDFPMRSIVAGTGVTIDSALNTITINSSGGGFSLFSESDSVTTSVLSPVGPNTSMRFNSPTYFAGNLDMLGFSLNSVAAVVGPTGSNLEISGTGGDTTLIGRGHSTGVVRIGRVGTGFVIDGDDLRGFDGTQTITGLDSLGVDRIKDGIIDEPDLDVSNSPTDNFLLSYNAAGTNFTWVAGGGSGTVTDQILTDTLDSYPDTSAVKDTNDVIRAEFAPAITHITSDGSDHTFIDQSVVSGSSPTLDGSNFTGVPFSDSTGAGVASDFIMDTIGAPTFSTVQQMQNIFHSSGWTSGGEFTDTTDGAGDIDSLYIAAGTGLIRAVDLDTDTNIILFFDWGDTTIVIPADTTLFIGVKYNGGVPVVFDTTADKSFFDHQQNFELGAVTNEAGVLHPLPNPHVVGDHASAMIIRTQGTMGIQRDNDVGGIMIGETGTRSITLTAGVLFAKLNTFTVSALDFSVAGSMDRYYQNGSGGWTKEAAVTQWNNTQWDDGDGGLATLGNNRWSLQYYYVELDDGSLVSLYGQTEYTSFAAAEGDTPPSALPKRLDFGQAILVSRIIFQKDASTIQEIQTRFPILFQGTATQDHGNLSGLGDDDHTQYLKESDTAAFALTILASPAVTGNMTTTGTIDTVDLAALGATVPLITDDTTNYQTAYTHSQDNTQAHSDYMLNTGNAVDSNDVATNSLSMPSDMAAFTKAELEGRTSDVADYYEADGDTPTGVHDFGGATSLEIPNGTAPAPTLAGQLFQDTDDDLLEGTDGTNDFVFAARYSTILIPIDGPSDLINDTILIPIRGFAPGGIIIDSIGIGVHDSVGTYAVDFEEWTDRNVTVGTESAIATVTVPGNAFDVASGAIAHTIEYGNLIMIEIPATTQARADIWIRYEKLGVD